MAIVRRGDNYYAVLSIDGKQKWVACGTNERRAKALHDEFIVKASRGELEFPKAIAFADFAEMWLRDYAALMLKPVTVYEYGISIRKYLLPEFGRMRVSAIRHQHIQTFISRLVREGRLSAKSIRNHIVPLRRMFTIAVRWGYASSNPAEKLALPRVVQREMAFLTIDQMRELIEATPSEWRALIALGCMCGLRKGECLGLQWSSVLWDDHSLDVRYSIWNGRLQEPKTKSSKSRVPMPATVENLLLERMTTSPASPMDLVFCRDDGSPLRPDWVNRGLLRPTLERAGLPSLGFHGLRHGFVAAHIASGTPIKVIQELARHASIQTTLDRYGHLQPEAKTNAARALDEALWGSGVSRP